MMGNENPTKKAEICGDRIRFIWTIHCIATVSMCASLTMMECIPASPVICVTGSLVAFPGKCAM